MDDKQFIDLIQSNIDKYGFHITIVNSDTIPRYAYTIGLSEDLGFELIMAGGYFYLKEELIQIFNSLVIQLKSDKSLLNSPIKAGSLGEFKLQEVHESWNEHMVLGVFDFYKTNETRSFQIIPEQNHYTLEIPDMKVPYSQKLFPIWKWLSANWELSIPSNSTTTTNIQSLQGNKITEVMRWEPNNWEMFAGAGPDVHEKDIRVVPIGVMLGIDETLIPSLDLVIEKGMWRDSSDMVWHDWG